MNDYPISVRLKDEQIDFLKKINENQAEAIRTVINESMNNTRRKKIQQGMLYIVFLITLATLVLMLFF